MLKSRIPEVETSSGHTVDGLTLSTVQTKTYSFTLEQLKHLVMADKLFAHPVPREYGLDMLCALIRKHRYELFGTCESYKIITNGYGQFKEVTFSHGNPVNAKTIFTKLETLLDN